ncbi:hypothetical protein [Sphingomonas sp.]|jgi:hypothetical protein|uniref:hypothetical protein n=1 Tax=Sphingomonas sp. TaxID=28214 RepID=UPI002ED83ACF
MSTHFDSYYYHRAEAELDQAQRSEHPAAVRAHYTLAGYYLDRFYGTQDEGISASLVPDRGEC